MTKWNRTISTKKDIVDFRDHLLQEIKRHKYLEDRFFPESIYVTGEAYKPLRAEIEIFLKRNTIGSFTDFVLRFFSLINSGGGTELLRFLGNFAEDYYRIKDEPYMIAAKKITEIGYYAIREEAAGKMRVYYDKMQEPDEPFVNMPNLY